MVQTYFSTKIMLKYIILVILIRSGQCYGKDIAIAIENLETSIFKILVDALVDAIFSLEIVRQWNPNATKQHGLVPMD